MLQSFPRTLIQGALMDGAITFMPQEEVHIAQFMLDTKQRKLKENFLRR